MFSLTRAMEHHHDNKWVVREYTLNNVSQRSQPVNATTENGELTFRNLVEGHYILEETAAPTGYALGDTHRWLLTLEKEDSADKILLVPYLTPLDEEGNPTGDRVALSLPDASNTIEHIVPNSPLPPIDLSLEKKWNDNGDTSVPDGAEATFVLMQKKISDSAPLTVRLVDANNNLMSTVTDVYPGDTIKIYDSSSETDLSNVFKHHTNAPSIGIGEVNRNDYVYLSTQTDLNWRIDTDTVYFLWGEVYSTSTSSGQYTVSEDDAAGGAITLRLSRSAIGNNYYHFDNIRYPVLYVVATGTGSSPSEEASQYAHFTLPADGDVGNPWKKTFHNLPVLDENGNAYTYYFEEVNHLPDDYSIQTIEGSMGQTSTSGNVVVTNNTPECFAFTKVWRDPLGNGSQQWPENTSITVTVRQGADENAPEYAKYTISETDLVLNREISALDDPQGEKAPLTVSGTDSGNGYVFKLFGLESGVTYTVSEETAAMGCQAPKYLDADGNQVQGIQIGNKGKIANDQIGVELPSTGGPGTKAFIAGGAVLTVTAVLGYAWKADRLALRAKRKG